MASRKPVIHGRDHLPGGADPILFVFPTSRYSNAIINEPVGGLVLYWKLDELGNTTTDVVDSSGNGHTGTYGAAPYHGGTDHPTLGVAALADGTSAEFDGADDMLGIYTDVPGIQGFGEMSVEFWMKTSQNAALDGGGSLDSTHVGIVTADTSSAGGRFFLVELTPGTGQLRYAIFGTDATGHPLDGAAIVNDGLRHHVVCTFDGTTMNIYVDGVLDVTAIPAMGGWPLASSNHGLFVGGGHPIPGPFVEQSHYQGVLDELAIYTIALPIGSVQTHYLLGSTASNPPSGTAGGDLTGNYPDPTIANSAVTTLKIADGAVTAAKLSPSPTGNNGKWLRLASGALAWQVVSADVVSITDGGGYFSSTDVEGALQELGLAGGGGGPVTTVLYDSTLGADAATIDTGAGVVVSGYSLIEVTLVARTNAAAVEDQVAVRFNNDGGGNYDWNVGLSYVSGVTNIHARTANQGVFSRVPAATATAGLAGIATLSIPGYAATTWNKMGSGTGGYMYDTASDSSLATHSFVHWRSTAAITRVAVIPITGTNFKTGSRLIVRGIA